MAEQQPDFFVKGSDNGVSYLDEMQESFIDYAMSVITSRALPDIRDGLKPVQRRILFAMANEGLLSDKKFTKCAGIVGEVLKKYHPHGDTAVYEALVRLAQPWVMRYQLIEGQGNFGSIDGDSPAAYRYTEARLDKLSTYLMTDIEKDTVDKGDNYNNTEKEPLVLPARFPNLLINGTSGIAVGMATNIPPHNLVEVIDALIALLKDPDLSVEEIMKYIKGPDFPTGASIISDGGIKDAYKTGRGTIRLRAEINIETEKDKKRIVISEIPYSVVKTRIITKIVELIKTKKIDGITDIRDESAKAGVRIVLDLAKGVPVDFIIEKLYKNTPLDSNFPVNMVALVDGKPQTVDIKRILDIFVHYREEIVRRRTAFELNKANEKKHILDGYKKVLDLKDKYLKEVLPKAKDKVDLKAKVEKEFGLTPIQSEALVILPNYRFAGMEVDKIIEEHKELSKLVEELDEILSSDQKIKKILRDEFTEIRTKFPDARKTRIISGFEDKKLDDLIPSQEVIVAITNGGFIKRYNPAAEQSERGSDVVFTGDDVVRFVCKADMAERALVFTADAKVYPLKVFSIPEMRRYGKGVDIKELLKIKEDIKVVGVFDEVVDKEILLLTKKGYAKRITLSEFKGIKSNGVSVFNLRKEDEVLSVNYADDDRLILQSNATVLELEPKKIELSPRGKAPDKIAEGIVSCAAKTMKDGERVFVYSDGSLFRGKPKEKTRQKPIAIVYDTLTKTMEYVAQTTGNNYILVDPKLEKVQLNADEEIKDFFAF
jgi:DNA gyrase subunit A